MSISYFLLVFPPLVVLPRVVDLFVLFETTEDFDFGSLFLGRFCPEELFVMLSPFPVLLFCFSLKSTKNTHFTNIKIGLLFQHFKIESATK